MKTRVAFAALVATVVASPAAAQFASDFPGVPRASISIAGGRQSRWAWALSGYKVPNTAGTGDTLAGGVRLGFGQSYRIQGQFEIGFDITLADGFAAKTPSPDANSAVKNDVYARGLAGYGFRIGGKFRPIAALDPDGYGYEVALGAAFGPELKSLYGYEVQGDSSRSGGQFNSDDKTKASAAFSDNPFAKLQSSTMVAAMASYRSRRLLADAALVAETVPDRAATADPSPLNVYTGVSPRVGASFRLTPGIAVGGSYWGTGSPPWWDEVRFHSPGKHSTEQYGFLAQFGSESESGLDLMVSSPTGNFAQSLRIYIRTRATH